MDTHEQEDVVRRVYEAGYHIVPSLKDEDVEKVVGEIRAIIEKAGGTFVAEAAPTMIRLAYPMDQREGEKYVEFDRAFFGWIKFEATTDAATKIEKALREKPTVIRCIVFKTLREDTRAKIKAPTLREVKRVDTIKAAPRRTEDEAGEGVPVSEEKLDKALEELIAE